MEAAPSCIGGEEMIYLSDGARKCIELLEESGFSAYAVGGAVRDGLLSRKAGDFDVCTNALPEQMQSVFADYRTVPTGIKHGTLTVLVDGEPIEITTWRVDGEYLDGRHPSSVSFSPLLYEDLARRDFTVNALAYNEREGIVDCFSGLRDLELGLIRCVGEPSKRYGEDALRILRAFRFASQLGFRIESETLSAASRCASGLSSIARERITAELLKLLAGEGVAYALGEMISSGVFAAAFEGVPTPDGETVKRIASMQGGDPILRLAALARAYSDGERERFIGLLRLSNREKRLIERLCLASRYAVGEQNDAAAARGFLALYRDISERALAMLSAFYEGDGDAPCAFCDAVMSEQKKSLCLTLLDLEVNGKDIAELCGGGALVGETLNVLLADVIADPSLNTRDILLDRARKYIKKTVDKV